MGDPKQAIYSFRGGDLDAYLSVRPADGARISSLATTYRSAPGLVRALNTLFGRHLAFGAPELPYPQARSARRDEELPCAGGRRRPARRLGGARRGRRLRRVEPRRARAGRRRRPAWRRPSWISWTGRWETMEGASFRPTWPC